MSTTELTAARTETLTKTYGSGDAQVVALDAVSVEFRRGKFTAVMGPSGSGKSTLMHCAAGLDSPSGGQVWIGDEAVVGLSDSKLTKLRRDKVGFIFQSFNLIPTLTAEENMELPLAIAGRQADPEWKRIIIETVGLQDRLTHKPSELSGGQQQRVACARALLSKPEIVFADEPTGNLDSRSSAEVLSFLRRSVDEFGQTIVMVTHDPVAASYADRAIFLADGQIVGELEHPTRDSVLQAMTRLNADEADLMSARSDAQQLDGGSRGNAPSPVVVRPETRSTAQTDEPVMPAEQPAGRRTATGTHALAEAPIDDDRDVHPRRVAKD